MVRDIAVAHKDAPTGGGGAERVAGQLADTVEGDLYTGGPIDVPLPDGVEPTEIDRTRLTRWARDRGGLLRDLANMIDWQHVPELAEYDTVLLSGNEPLWYVPEDHQTVVTYTHSTPRALYDLFHRSAPSLAKRALAPQMRAWIESQTTHPDLWVCNSDLVARRLHQQWDIPPRRIRVVYPPVDVDTFDPDIAPTEGYYLYVGPLAERKRLERVIRAFKNQPGRQLMIAGDGPERDRLEGLADENITFLGYVSEERKRALLAGARAFVFNAANEDFGIAPIEALASGTPVIGVADGFTQYQIRDGANGILYPREPGALVDALNRFEREGVAWSPLDMQAWAEQFAPGRFRHQIRAAVEEARERTEITPQCQASLEGEFPEPQPHAEQAVARTDRGSDA